MKKYPDYTHLAQVVLFRHVATNQDLKLDIANNMRTYGGSFVQALAECLMRADKDNTYTLAKAFSGYFYKYLPSKWNRKGVTKTNGS